MPASASGTRRRGPSRICGSSAAILQRHLGIAAEAEGAHGDGLDHGAEAADGGAFRVEARAAAGRARRRRWWCRRCRRRRRRRGRSCGGRRPGWRRGRTGSSRSAAARAKAAETSAPSPRTTISGAAMSARGEKAFGGGDQPVDHRDQPGVEQRGERAARAAELGRQLVAGGDRQAGPLADQVAGGDLVRRVAGGEIGADREARDRFAEFRQRRFERRTGRAAAACRGRRGRPGRTPPDRCRARPSGRRGRGRPRKSRS